MPFTLPVEIEAAEPWALLQIEPVLENPLAEVR
jgi:hypothetical protein